MAAAWQEHGRGMAGAWQAHGSGMAGAWQAHDKRTAGAWQQHGDVYIYMRLYADIHPVLSLELPLPVSADLNFFLMGRSGAQI